MARPPPFGTGMSSDIPHMIQQRARQTANVVAAKRAVFGLGPVLLRLDLGEAVPFPVRRQDCGEQLDLGAFISQPGRMGVSERFGDAVPQILCAPSVVKAYVEQMRARSEEHTSELQSLMRNSYAVFCLKKNNISTAFT